MIREYANENIYSNFRKAHILSTVALAMSVFSIVAFTCIKYLLLKYEGIDVLQFVFYLLILSTPIGHFAYSRQASSHKDGQNIYVPMHGETKLNNDFANTLTQAITSFLPGAVLSFFNLAADPPIWAFMIVFMEASHVFIYIADILFIINCVLIRREWKDAPPAYIRRENELKQYKQQREERERLLKQQQEEREKLTSTCTCLLEKCGMRFFIKYFDQITRLPIRDVLIEEDYGAVERQERLVAAKELVESEEQIIFCFGHIIKHYSGVLSEGEIQKARIYLERYSKAQGANAVSNNQNIQRPQP